MVRQDEIAGVSIARKYTLGPFGEAGSVSPWDALPADCQYTVNLRLKWYQLIPVPRLSTAAAKTERLRIRVELDGVFESTEAVEVSIAPQSWNELVVTKAVEQGTQILMRLQEQDGSWSDFRLWNYHQQNGTAFALMTLRQCVKEVSDTPPNP